MHNGLQNDPSLSDSSLPGKNIKKPDVTAGRKVVIPDECGDSLWDEPPEQNDQPLPPKIVENKASVKSKGEEN